MGIRSWIVWRGKDIGYSLLAKLLWPRASAAVVVLKDEEVLAIDTGEYLMLPGGGLEKGESFEETARREVREETGLRIEVERCLEESINSVGGPEKIFLGEPAGGDLTSYWEGEPVWIEKSEAGKRKWRHNRDIVDLLEKAEES